MTRGPSNKPNAKNSKRLSIYEIIKRAETSSNIAEEAYKQRRVRSKRWMVKCLSRQMFVFKLEAGSASNFPGIGSQSYDVVFSNQVIHWIPDKSSRTWLKVLKVEENSHSVKWSYFSFFILRLQGIQFRANPENSEEIYEIDSQRENKPFEVGAKPRRLPVKSTTLN